MRDEIDSHLIQIGRIGAGFINFQGRKVIVRRLSWAKRMSLADSYASFSDTMLPPGAAKHARLKSALALWDAKRGSRPYPARGDIAPRELAPFLANVTLWRSWGEDYEYRIVGDAVVAAYGHNMTGRLVSELMCVNRDVGERLKRTLDRAAQGAAVLNEGWITTNEGRLVGHEMIFLPLGDETVDHILGVSVHGWR